MSLACSTTVSARSDPEIFMLGTRDVAAPLRQRVEAAIEAGGIPVCVDFAELLVTQSFMDEFLGVLILRHGPRILDQIVFRNCRDDVKAAIELVAMVRSRDYQARRDNVST